MLQSFDDWKQTRALEQQQQQQQQQQRDELSESTDETISEVIACIGLGLGWVGLAWVGLSWVGLAWLALGWIWFVFVLCQDDLPDQQLNSMMSKVEMAVLGHPKSTGGEADDVYRVFCAVCVCVLCVCGLFDQCVCIKLRLVQDQERDHNKKRTHQAKLFTYHHVCLHSFGYVEP